MLNKFFLLTTILLWHLANAYSQNKLPITFGKVSLEDFIVKSPLVDGNSSAVIIADIGDTKFTGNSKGWFTYIFKHQKRIKILDKKAFGLAILQIPLYHDDDSEEKVENLSAVTYNVENEKVTETKLNPKDIFDEKADKNFSYKKFSMPGVKEGSIIEYSYTIKSDFEFNLPAWEFQNDICPALWSEYNVTIPGMLSYMSFFQGKHQFFINAGSEGFQDYSIRRMKNIGLTNEEERITVSGPTNIHRWVMKDVPAFKTENFISSPLNYMDKISFQLYQTYDGSEYHDVANNWMKVTDELMKREDFGLSLAEDNYWLDDLLKTVVKDNEDQLHAAQRIYYYVQNNYACTNYHNKYLKTNLRDVVKRKNGTVGDINLLLIALLQRKYISAFPVLLSTNDAGFNSSAYPQMERLDYAICKATINSVDYYLDATQPFLGFGKLPLYCYNGHARVISKDTTAVFFLTDSIKETSLTNVVISNTDDGQWEGSYNNTMGFFESLDTKKSIAQSNINNYETRLKDTYREDFVIDSIKVDSFETPEGEVSVKFDFKIKSFQNSDIFYLNPLMGEALKKNPFFAAERIYPVEMPYKVEETYVLYLEIPTGYAIDELPKSTLVKLNENEGFYEYLIRSDGKTVQMRRRLFLYKANFESTDYKTLRDFYEIIVSKETQQIVFKKIK